MINSMINFGRDMALTMARVKLSTQKAQLDKMLANGEIEQAVFDGSLLECYEEFTRSFDVIFAVKSKAD